jgi:hypothetical protein
MPEGLSVEGVQVHVMDDDVDQVPVSEGVDAPGMDVSILTTQALL